MASTFLYLGEFCSVDRRLVYRLDGAIAHNGPTLHSGHYIASVRVHGGADIVSMNDVEEVTKHEGTLDELEDPRGQTSKGFESYLLESIKVGYLVGVPITAFTTNVAVSILPCLTETI